MFEEDDYMDMGETPQLKLTPSTLERKAKTGSYPEPRFDSDSDDYADMSQATPRRHQAAAVVMRKNSVSSPHKRAARKMTVSSKYDDSDYAEFSPARSAAKMTTQEEDYAVINEQQEVYADMNGVSTRSTTVSSSGSSLSAHNSYRDHGYQATRPKSISITPDKRNNSAPDMNPSCHDNLYADMSSPTVVKRPHARSDGPQTKPPVYWKATHANNKTQSAKMHRKKFPVKVMKTSESFRSRSSALSMSRDRLEELGTLSRAQQQRKRFSFDFDL